MNKVIKITVVLMMYLPLAACVSKSQFRELQLKVTIKAESNKLIRKEIRGAEKSNKAIEDSITENLRLAELQTYKIEKRLAEKSIKVKLDPKALSKLNIQNQSVTDEYYNSLQNSCNFKDTNSAKNTKYLSSSERELIYWLNCARLNPTKFCMQYIYPLYLRDPNNEYLATLMDYMLTMKPVPALYPNEVLFQSAKCHAESMGKAGLIGHKRLDGCTSKFSGECCSYGLSKPLDIVLQLLVDKGVTSLGHRYICLGFYSKIGVSQMPHKGFGTNVVLDFGYNSI